MSRRDDEPVFVAEYSDRDSAESAWEALMDADIPGAVITESPPWGEPIHRVQVRRADAAAAVAALNSASR